MISFYSLRWTEETLSPRFWHAKYSECKIHRELKIALYVEMIDLFDKGQMWEQGCIKFIIKSVGEEYQVVERGREISRLWE